MSTVAQTISSFIGRGLLGIYFIWQGINALFSGENLQSMIQVAGHPWGPFLHFTIVSILMVGGLSLCVGYKTRLGAFLLLAAMLTIAACRYDPWDWITPGVQTRIHNMLNELALLGGLFLLMAFGPGKASLSRSDSSSKAKATAK
jgi:putative oxidoreductase